MRSDYEVGVDGPRMIMKNKLAKQFDSISHIHGLSGVLMNETQMMDTRMNLLALLTSSIEGFVPGMKGTTLVNYVEVTDLIKNSEGKITGAKLVDKLTKKEHTVKCKVVVNCTGVHADELRRKDDP
jgi:glycerol-3-phosphate dehydrogenase